MQRRAVLFGVFDGLQEDGVLLEAAVLHSGVQTDVILHDAAACTQIGVACLGVAGLSASQANMLAGGVELAPGLLRQQGIPVGGIRQMDRIAVIAGTETPTIADDEQHLPVLAEIVSLRQRSAGHLRRLGDTHDVQHRRRHVTQTAVPQGNGAAVGGVHQNERHQIGGVGAVGLACGGVQLFNVAVVRGDGHHIALGQRVMHHHIQIVADMLAGFQLGGGIQGVADHVAVGEVGHHEIVFAQSAHDLIRHGRQAQLRLLVKVNALGGRHAHVILAGEGRVLAAVEEKGHMGILLALRAVELILPRLAEDLSQRLHHMRRRKGDGQILELIMIHGHDDEIQILQLVPLHLVEVRIGEQLRQLDLPLTAAAAEHGGIAVSDLAHRLAVLHQDHGFQMVVILPRLIRFFHGPRQLCAAALGFRHKKYLLMSRAVRETVLSRATAHFFIRPGRTYCPSSGGISFSTATCPRLGKISSRSGNR